MEDNPIIEICKIAEALNVAFDTVSRAVNRLIEKGILIQSDNKRRNRTFAMKHTSMFGEKELDARSIIVAKYSF